jgi:hypothetical protein
MRFCRRFRFHNYDKKLLVATRICRSTEMAEDRKKELQMLEEWEDTLRETCGDLMEQNEKFLNSLVLQQEKEKEIFYICGLKDGIRLMKQILEL